MLLNDTDWEVLAPCRQIVREYDTTGSGTLNIDEIALVLANVRNVQIRSTDLEREFEVQFERPVLLPHSSHRLSCCQGL